MNLLLLRLLLLESWLLVVLFSTIITIKITITMMMIIARFFREYYIT